MRKAFCWLIIVLLLSGTAVSMAESAAAAPGLEKFIVRNGDRESKKVAITMDDCNEREWVWKTVELCRQYGITVTFFPNGYNLLEEERDGWLDVLAAGCEIGSHGQSHLEIRDIGPWKLLFRMGHFQQKLDEVLGEHYPVRWFRPPFGRITDSDGKSRANENTIRKYGYDHILLWDVSFSPGFKTKDVLKDVKGGSIILFHARKRDYNCLEELIPLLLEQDYELVTVSRLFGFDPPQTGGELYVYNQDDFR